MTGDSSPVAIVAPVASNCTYITQTLQQQMRLNTHTFCCSSIAALLKAQVRVLLSDAAALVLIVTCLIWLAAKQRHTGLPASDVPHLLCLFLPLSC